MNWASYLARGIPQSSHPKIIYHMCIRQDFEDQTINNQLYFPPTYQQDGFIHATSDPSLLLSIGTYFYKNDRNEWICLEIDTNKLISPVKFEPGSFFFFLFTKKKLLLFLFILINYSLSL